MAEKEPCAGEVAITVSTAAREETRALSGLEDVDIAGSYAEKTLHLVANADIVVVRDSEFRRFSLRNVDIVAATVSIAATLKRFDTHTHTHAHTHARTHARAHARTHTRTHARTHAHIRTHTQ